MLNINLKELTINWPISIITAIIIIVLVCTSVLLFSKKNREKNKENTLATLYPNLVTVNKKENFRIIYKVGEKGFKKNGKIKVEFPHEFFEYENVKPQVKNPKAKNYFSTTTSSPETELSYKIEPIGIDGQWHRYAKTFTIRVRKKGIKKGDEIKMNFLNVTTPMIADKVFVIVATDSDNDKKFDDFNDKLELKVAAGKPKRIRVIAPSIVTKDTPFEFRVVALDKYDNNTERFKDKISFTSSDKKGNLPESYTFKEQDIGMKVFEATFSKKGKQKITLYDNTTKKKIESNPILVKKVPNKFIVWGDIHSHSGISHDGFRNPESAVLYAKNISSLDFHALTDHSSVKTGKYGFLKGYTDDEWENMKKIVKELYEPGKFVTFLGYEWSGKPPYGHRNIIYKQVSGPMFHRHLYPRIGQLWKAFDKEEIDVITIPHHTGVIWPSKKSPYVSWDYNNKYQTSAEIYSQWGANEYFGNPLSYEDVTDNEKTSNPGPYYLRDAWVSGQKLGITGSSDDHRGKPGRHGLTAVIVNELTREKVFEAIRKGHTYATRKERIILEFDSDGYIMGDEYETSKFPTFHVNVIGTSKIKSIELIKSCNGQYSTIHQVEGNKDHIKFNYKDKQWNANSMYYIRVRQTKPIEGNETMAWSSPIWVMKK